MAYYLVDIGNTYFHIYKDGKIMHLKEPVKLDGKIYFISVNEEKKEKFLKLNRAIDLEPFIDLKTDYVGLGVDRAVLCKAIEDGVVVDAGSAVTIDVMDRGVHKGGVIIPGLFAFKKAFMEISSRLNKDFCEFSNFPKNTSEAISAGSIGLIKCMVEKLKGNKKVYLTGGDGKFLAEFIDGEYKEDLIFDGMKKIIKGIK